MTRKIWDSQTRIDREWLVRQGACSVAARRFTKHFPNGLALTRRNLFKAARALPMSSLVWLGVKLIQPRSSKAWTRWVRLRIVAQNTEQGDFVRSPAKKETFARALADRLRL